ncbi:MAG TPA: rRNA maturation RNase YbeY [bacterium]|nr:rRNA maturation RNase YbeY [bacterium]
MTATPRLILHPAIEDASFPGSAATLRRLARRVLTAERVHGRVGIYVVTARTMARLNRQLLDRRGATDVLTLCYNEGPAVVDPCDWRGEVWICWAVARRDAARYGQTPAAEWRRYLIHGLLHLAGYEHEGVSANVAARMRAREARYLERMA